MTPDTHQLTRLHHARTAQNPPWQGEGWSLEGEGGSRTNPLFGVGSSSAHPGHEEGVAASSLQYPLPPGSPPRLVPPREVSPFQLSSSFGQPPASWKYIGGAGSSSVASQGGLKCCIRVSSQVLLMAGWALKGQDSYVQVPTCQRCVTLLVLAHAINHPVGKQPWGADRAGGCPGPCTDIQAPCTLHSIPNTLRMDRGNHHQCPIRPARVTVPANHGALSPMSVTALTIFKVK